jgi:hypothetical protein
MATVERCLFLLVKSAAAFRSGKEGPIPLGMRATRPPLSNSRRACMLWCVVWESGLVDYEASSGQRPRFRYGSFGGCVSHGPKSGSGWRTDQRLKRIGNVGSCRASERWGLTTKTPWCGSSPTIGGRSRPSPRSPRSAPDSTKTRRSWSSPVPSTPRRVRCGLGNLTPRSWA